MIEPFHSIENHKCQKVAKFFMQFFGLWPPDTPMEKYFADFALLVAIQMVAAFCIMITSNLWYERNNFLVSMFDKTIVNVMLFIICCSFLSRYSFMWFQLFLSRIQKSQNFWYFFSTVKSCMISSISPEIISFEDVMKRSICRS